MSKYKTQLTALARREDSAGRADLARFRREQMDSYDRADADTKAWLDAAIANPKHPGAGWTCDAEKSLCTCERPKHDGGGDMDDPAKARADMIAARRDAAMQPTAAPERTDATATAPTDETPAQAYASMVARRAHGGF